MNLERVNSDEIAQKITLYEQNSAQLTRSQRIELRNEIIMMQLATGTSNEEIQETFHLKRRQLYNIIAEAEANSENWYKNLLKNYMMEIFRINTLEVFREINYLKTLRNKMDDPVKDQKLSMDIIHSRIELTKMVADGPVLVQVKEELARAEDWMNKYMTKKRL